MKKFIVESRRDYKETYNNYYDDIIEADTEEEAIELYKKWLIENHYCHNDIEELTELYKKWLIESDYELDEIEEWQYRVIDYGVSNGNGGNGHDKTRCY